MSLKVGKSYKCMLIKEWFTIVGQQGSIFNAICEEIQGFGLAYFYNDGVEYTEEDMKYELDLDSERDALLEIKPRESAQPTAIRRKHMAKVTVQIAGGEAKVIEADTIEEAKRKVNAAGYTANVNGEPESDDYELSDYEFVSLAKPVKAG